MRKRVVVASGVVAFVMAVVLGAPASCRGPDAIPGPGRRGCPKGVLPLGRGGGEGVGSRAREKEGGSGGASLRSLQAPPGGSAEDPVGPSGPARVLHHRHVYAAAAPPQRRQAVVHAGGGHRRVRVSGRHRRERRSGRGSLRLERVRDGGVAESGSTEHAHRRWLSIRRPGRFLR